MANTHQHQSWDIPPDYQLPHVSSATVESFEFRPPEFETALAEFSVSNEVLINWLRREATKRFPHDLSQRKVAIGMVLNALGIVQNQQISESLAQQLGELQFDPLELPPAA